MDKFQIEKLNFSVRVQNCFKSVGVTTVGDLLKYTEQDLLNIPNFGKRSLEEVKSVLKKKLEITFPA